MNFIFSLSHPNERRVLSSVDAVPIVPQGEVASVNHQSKRFIGEICHPWCLNAKLKQSDNTTCTEHKT